MRNIIRQTRIRRAIDRIEDLLNDRRTQTRREACTPPRGNPVLI